MTDWKPGTVFGVFGGSFDPPHMSHVLACLWALETGEIHRVLVIPCGQHALDKPIVAPFEDRWQMCRLAMTRLKDLVEVLDIEGRRDQVSYTIDTLRTLKAERPGCAWRLLIGSDILSQTARWKEWEEIERLAPPLVVPRLTGEEADLVPGGDLRAVSSTRLREMLSRGTVPFGAIPDTVQRYIRDHGLYREHE